MEDDFASLLSIVASNDPALVELDISSGTPDIPENSAELVQRVVAALATNTHVKSLKLALLQLTEDNIAPLAELLKTRDFEQLDLKRNDLSGEILFPALAAQKSLRVLRLSYNKRLTALQHLSGLKNLKELGLSSCGLSAASLAGLQTSHLEELTLYGNPLKTLPDTFASLVNLKELDVVECGFSEFPAVLLSLTHLEKLDISYNQLTIIPDGIAALVNLKIFHAHNCGLEGFQITITQLVHLEELSLARNNNIKLVPEEIGNLRSLKQLYLSDCGLTELPLALWTLAHLEVLDLSSNPLTLLPGGIGALSQLKELHLLDCPIATLPSEMQLLSFLQFLDISFTNITHVPVWLASLRSLRCFDCPLSGVAVNESTLVTFGELAALVSESSDPEAVGKLRRSFQAMSREDSLRLLRITNMHFAPRTPLRALCVSKCVANYSRVDAARLPAHIRDEIARDAGLEQEEATTQPNHA